MKALMLPESVFCNTTDPGIVLFLNRAKPEARQGKVFLVNTSQVFEKGDPKNFIPDEGIQRITDTDGFTMLGIDAEGIDLKVKNRLGRISLARAIGWAAEARDVLVEMAANRH